MLMPEFRFTALEDTGRARSRHMPDEFIADSGSHVTDAFRRLSEAASLVPECRTCSACIPLRLRKFHFKIRRIYGILAALFRAERWY